MQIITSKTDQAIRNHFSRRQFLKLTGSAGVAVIVYSEFGVAHVCLGGGGLTWLSLFEYFGSFALNLGMQFLGSTAKQYLTDHPNIDSALDNFTQGVSGNEYSPYYDWKQIGGYNSTFFPVQSHRNFMLPFFSTDDGQFGSPIKWYTGLTMPTVDKTLQNDGMDVSERAGCLVPREPNGSDTANDFLLPESYVTDNGSMNYAYKGDQHEGECNWTVYVKDDNSSHLHKPLRRGTTAVSIYA